MQNFSRSERIAVAFYFIWFFVHLAFFFYSEESSDNGQFWPFITAGKTLASTYDVSEFLLYIGVPLILFIAYRIVYGVAYDESNGGHRHTSTSFFISFLDEKIKAEELTQKINKLNNQPANYDHLDELKADREKAASKGVKTWLDRVEVKKKYKDFQS
ncbi:MAG: hypothetical protein IPP72_01640 [Chitinophagaceae bacterium]|nr:hypothetical protein [Chitinophagaceae bacterium]